ncbi:MAG TPA: toxin-antitoxin system, antitoxin component [Spirochaetota bacterium]|jgi:hypothetical protein|nr:toxin-antitoxin system, antitoxin component [Spirochaetota bacterium]HOH36755.1 toxin-antitoxin system, antitoxin component [Spirochaetota bacterium]HPJ15012.1 toxin-antitoxin system, antitoxin component [Spirochaetota bacterium]HPM35277.1 toxin-antitoxin system, antitoxin component [Spirochaetota bacterium]HPY03104.1 toxin-antitoxin system, antitoxin component [Spirochaetota bacterium]
MPQVSLYIDNETMQKIEKAASRENVSISKWVGKSLKKVFKDDYPDNYFDLFGSIDDNSFEIPSLDLKSESKR